MKLQGIAILLQSESPYLQNVEVYLGSGVVTAIWSLLIITALLLACLYIRAVRKNKRVSDYLNKTKKNLKTQKEQLEMVRQELISTSKMAALGRLSASIGHEINIPLAAIQSNVQFVDDSQMGELKLFGKLVECTSKTELQNMVELIMESVASKYISYPTDKQNKLKGDLKKFFEAQFPERSEELTEIFNDLGIYDDLTKYESLLAHPQYELIFDFVSYVSQRNYAIKISEKAANRANKILSNLRTYIYDQNGSEKKKFDLLANIDTILLLHKGSLKDVEIIKEYQEIPSLIGYPDELSQVWTNLILNAAYAMGYQGQLQIRVGQSSDKYLDVEIEDTGGGIKNDLSKDIFDPFVTTKPKGEGSGLGLNICKKIIEMHEGNIQWKNTKLGAVFTVQLPQSLPN